MCMFNTDTFFFLDIFYLRLIESMGAEPRDMESQVHMQWDYLEADFLVC